MNLKDIQRYDNFKKGKISIIFIKINKKYHFVTCDNNQIKLEGCNVSIIYIYTLLDWVSVCLFVCLFPINVKTAEIKFCVGPHMTPGKVYGCSK